MLGVSSNNPNVGNHDVIPLLSAQIPTDGDLFANLAVSGVPSDAKMLAGTLRPPNFLENGAELPQSASVIGLSCADNANLRQNFALTGAFISPRSRSGRTPRAVPAAPPEPSQAHHEVK